MRTFNEQLDAFSDAVFRETGDSEEVSAKRRGSVEELFFVINLGILSRNLPN